MRKIIYKIVSVILCLSTVISGVIVFDLNDVIYNEAEASVLDNFATVSFGRYPQSMVTDSALIEELEKAPCRSFYENIDTTGMYLSVDDDETYWVDYNDDVYCKKRSGHPCDLGGKYHYYYVEPIEWIVVGEYMISKNVLEQKRYQKPRLHGELVDTEWEDSCLSKWLNNAFYEIAFLEAEKALLGTNSKLNCNVFIPSLEDLCGKTFRKMITSCQFYEISKNTAENTGFPYYIRTQSLLTYGSDFYYNNCNSSKWATEWLYRTDKGASAVYRDETFNGRKDVARIYGGSLSTKAVGGIRPAIYLGGSGFEYSDAKDEYPEIEKDDAINFLRFIYNQNDSSLLSSSNSEMKNDYQYKILTGEIFDEDMSVHEIQTLVMDFCWLVEIIINKYVVNAKEKSDIARKEVSDFLVKNLGNEITEDIKVEVAKGLFLSLIHGFDKIISKSSVAEKMGVYIGDIKEFSDQFIVKYLKVADIIDTIEGAISFSGWVIADEVYGRYGYFNTYLNNRHNPGYEETNKEFFRNYAEYGVASNTINFFSWVTGEDSWQKHKDDIERWAEQLYQLHQFATKVFHKYETVTDYPNCTDPGTKRVVCSYCDEVISEETVEPKGHTYKKTTIAPGCYEEGYDLYKCADCDESYKTNLKEATGHINYTVKTIEPTCAAYGYDLYTCKCGFEWTDNIVEPKGHSYKKTVVAPTETEQGYTVYTCSECSGKYFDDYTDPTGHEFIAVVTNPTCETEGFTTHICSCCGYEYVDSYVDMTEHVYMQVSETKPTCTSEGTRAYSCTSCGATKTETVAAKEHDYSYGTRIVAPTCEERGYVIHTCVCGAEMNDSYTNYLTHNFSVTESVAPNCYEDGFTKYTCSECGYTYSDMIPKTGHSYEFVETVTGNCFKSSYTLSKCTVCDGLKYENCVYADGHDMGEWATVREATSTKKGLMKRICDDCDYYETKDIKYSIYISIVDPTERTVTYGTPMHLYVNAPTLPDGYKILWKAEGKGVELEPSATGRVCTVNATSTGNVVVSAYVVNANGNTVTDLNGKQVMDSEYLYTKANVFMKIFEFFKKLFGFDWTSKLY